MASKSLLSTFTSAITETVSKAAVGVTNPVSSIPGVRNFFGGILESFGRLFRHAVKLYIYPMRADTYRRFMEARGVKLGEALPSGEVIGVANMPIPPHLLHLYTHLVENRNIVPITGYDPAVMPVLADDVRRLIKQQDPAWTRMVPEKVAAMIRRRGLFGCGPA